MQSMPNRFLIMRAHPELMYLTEIWDRETGHMRAVTEEDSVSLPVVVSSPLVQRVPGPRVSIAAHSLRHWCRRQSEEQADGTRQ